MKKFTQFLLIAGFILAGQCLVYGQLPKIALQHNGGLTVYTNLTLALAGAVNGDTIYLPGGPVYSSANITINKSLTIIGAGHHPDSTTATYKTVIAVNIVIATGADNGSISGIQCDNISFGTTTSNQNVNNYKIERCNLGTLKPSYGTGSTSQNIVISENVIDYLYGISTDYAFSTVLFEKNIFGPNSSYLKDALFNNNIFYRSTNYFTWSYGTYNNCIIIYTGIAVGFYIGSTYTIFNNTLISYTVATSMIAIWSGMYNNPISSEPATSTFVNAITSVFSYSNNYHLKPTSYGYNAGTDGTDVGIYGTIYPAKVGAVPFNPHISYKNIGTVLTPTGVLSVDVKVSAQDR